ncbi:MAG: biotin transporter BioY [Haloarculaceae archaeon]
MSTDTRDVELVGEEVLENVARAALFAALIGAFAYVSFPNPLSPQGLPVTLQVLGVFLAGIMLGPLWGGFALVLYLLAGAVGAPIFQGGSAGLGHLLGAPTMGYLWGYPLAAVAIGAIVHGGATIRDPQEVHVARLVGAMVVGTAIIYALGMAGLMLVSGLGLAAAFTAGAAPFIPAELVKLVAAVAVVRSDELAAE